MRTVYTTEKVAIDGVMVLPVSALPYSEKILMRRKALLRSATLPEKVAASMLGKFVRKPTRQAFFLIRKRHYFLDFFFPDLMLAVEIDGSSHRLRKEHDRKRDADFRSIGIRTIRIKNKDVMEGKTYDKLYARFYR